MQVFSLMMSLMNRDGFGFLGFFREIENSIEIGK